MRGVGLCRPLLHLPRNPAEPEPMLYTQPHRAEQSRQDRFWALPRFGRPETPGRTTSAERWKSGASELAAALRII